MLLRAVEIIFWRSEVRTGVHHLLIEEEPVEIGREVIVVIDCLPITFHRMNRTAQPPISDDRSKALSWRKLSQRCSREQLFQDVVLLLKEPFSNPEDRLDVAFNIKVSEYVRFAESEIARRREY